MGNVVTDHGKSLHGGHSYEKPGKVKEFVSSQGKVRENVFVQVVNYCEYCQYYCFCAM